MPRTYIARLRVRIVASGACGRTAVTNARPIAHHCPLGTPSDPTLSLPGLPAHLFAPTRVHRAPALV